MVVLEPAQVHARGGDDSPAIGTGRAILRPRGTGHRHFRNILVFLAGDRVQIESLRQATRKLLAWKSIDHDRKSCILNPDDFQNGLIAKQLEDADQRVAGQVGETYQWLLVPSQRADELLETWQAVGLTGTGVYQRASRKLIKDEPLIAWYSGARRGVISMGALSRSSLAPGPFGHAAALAGLCDQPVPSPPARR